MSEKILLVEDDNNLGFIIRDSLTEKGFEVIWERDGDSGLEAYNNQIPNLCILDVMLPKKDGFEIASEIRKNDNHTPIIFLTARDMIDDKLKGFRSGGDDYICKPFSMQELLLRIQVFLKRSSAFENRLDKSKSLYTYKNLKIDFAKNHLKIDDKEKKLTEKEAKILAILTSNKSRIVERNEILLNVWGDDDYFIGRSLDVFISKIRKYISASDCKISNSHGLGFIWEES